MFGRGLEDAVAETLGVQALISASHDGWKQKIAAVEEEKVSTVPPEIEKDVEVVVEASPEAFVRVQEAEARRNDILAQLAKLKDSADSGLHAVLKLSVVSCAQNSSISACVPGNATFQDKVEC